jgi:cell division protease FtsH
LAQALLEYETIDGAEVEMLVNGAQVKEIEKVRANRRDGGMTVAPGSSTSGHSDAVTKKSSSDPVGNTGPVTT